ncbi:temptin-like [Physella acuta]|uniref:temptin-like n=1 Tax=Physella acuta TaxID=109671 RepID=UPI0027DBB914|nr:temptin-like [Physella acuta]
MLRLTLAVALLGCVTAFPNFRDEIPNGHNVPIPCKPTEKWPGVGHFNFYGTRAQNQFGLDFKAAGNKWTKELCQKDSDNDGVTNGNELGDPDCIWTPGKEPTRRDQITHPGICDPWYSPTCFSTVLPSQLYKTQEDWMRVVCIGDPRIA